jgi:hypothetical protein
VEPEVAQFEALLRAEGVEQERERIREVSPLVDWGSDNYGEPFYIVDVDLLAPKEVIHTKILYPPASVLAPAPKETTLPLAESRALVEKGIVLETAMSWYEDHHVQSETVSELKWYVTDTMKADMTRDNLICPAPVLSELLDAIKAGCGSVEFQAVCDKDVSWKAICFKRGGLEAHYANRVSTDLLAAAALLLEVSK